MGKLGKALGLNFKANDSRLIFQRFRRNSPQPRCVSPRADQAFIPSVAFLLGVATFTLGHKTLGREMTVCQNLVPLVNIKIAGKWMFIPLKMVLIGIDPYPDGDPAGCQLVTQQTEESWFGHAGQILHHVRDRRVFRIFFQYFFVTRWFEMLIHVDSILIYS